jgi:high affinity Mn2+ porin
MSRSIRAFKCLSLSAFLIFILVSPKADAVPQIFAQQPSDAGVGGEGDSPETTKPEIYSIHGQFTNVTQYHSRFASPYRGPNSLDPGNRGNETIDLTLFLGLRLWQGGEVYANPEVDQGFGLSNTLGLAGFPSAEAYKVGAADPYVRLHRAFFRQSFDLGGTEQPLAADANQLGGTRSSDNLIVTIGKFSAVDIFDTNAYAHDPRVDFLNWAIVDAGAFDYTADAWGYTYGASAEWTQSWWTLRGGFFNLSRVPNSTRLGRGFGQFSAIAEAEERHEIFGQPGKLKLLVYANRGRMANYLDAVRQAAGTGNVPDVATARKYATRPGVELNLEQQITAGLGLFVRGSINDGRKEAYEFTEINRSISTGISLKGDRWNRPNDTFGLAGVVNGLSNPAVAYFRAGGLGILIGDGQLRRYGLEKIMETYYSASIIEDVAVTIDYQHIDNPAYNAERGPVSVFGFRVHAKF